MWSDWLADTLNRSTAADLERDPKPAQVRVHDDVLSADWEAVTGLLIHEGFGAEYPDA
ncbi:MAG TPA: hypothetical protein VMH36_04660 [Alphaproteobacteria bacterium]|nr:hypothetical protein [Alphaproteobacteria bacterium]